jgi:hypothetical protein
MDFMDFGERIINFDLLANPDILDKVILWRIERERKNPMQRMFNIEVRVDYADSDKNEEMKRAVRRAARHILAQAQLLADAVQPQAVAYADDFFSGHQEIALLEDDIGAALDEHGHEEHAVSQDLINAAREMDSGTK